MTKDEDRNATGWAGVAVVAESGGTTSARRPWHHRRRALIGAGVAAAMAAALAIGTLPVTHEPASSDSASMVSGSVGNGSGDDHVVGPGTSQDATTATASQSSGVVLIDTVLGYSGEEGAGTGMVLTSSGTVLTNNHVIEGSTAIKVTVPSTGKTYTATVVGSDTTDDVAVLKLSGASGLATIRIDDDAETVGQAVTAVGNAEGQDSLTAAAGTITALKASVTTASEGAVAGETLRNMLQTSADVVSGDSGGALIDSQAEVVGMDTAASSGTTPTVAYAIPIERALTIATSIRKGETSSTVTLGYPAFLGVEVSSDADTTAYGPGATQGATSGGGGAVIAGVFQGTPAATAGLEEGDTITAIGGTTVSSSGELSKALSDFRPGQKISVTWTDQTGDSRTASVTLAQGPAA